MPVIIANILIYYFLHKKIPQAVHIENGLISFQYLWGSRIVSSISIKNSDIKEITRFFIEDAIRIRTKDNNDIEIRSVDPGNINILRAIPSIVGG
jgi:hypothetical protein